MRSIHSIQILPYSILVKESKALDPGVRGEVHVCYFSVGICQDSERGGVQGSPGVSERVEGVVLVTDPCSVPQREEIGWQPGSEGRLRRGDW